MKQSPRRRRRKPHVSCRISHVAYGGFALIEVLIYVGLFVFLIGMVMLTFYQILSSSNAGRNRSTVEAEADFIMRKIEWALAGAETVHAPAAGATGTQLSVSRFNFPENPVAVNLVSSRIELQRGVGSPTQLNTSNVRIDALEFRHEAEVVNRPETVEITLSVSASLIEQGARASTTLRNTIYLRYLRR